MFPSQKLIYVVRKNVRVAIYVKQKKKKVLNYISNKDKINKSIGFQLNTSDTKLEPGISHLLKI